MNNNFYENYNGNNENYNRNNDYNGDSTDQQREYSFLQQSAVTQTTNRQNPYYRPQHARQQQWQTNSYINTFPYGNKQKSKKKKMSTGAVAVIAAVCIIFSGFAGFGGSYMFSKLSALSNDSSNQINEASADNSIVRTSADTTDKTTSEIVGEVADSVVEITVEVTQTDMFYGEYTAQGAGSGVIISEDGYILTNNHVAGDASKITVTLRSGESYEAELIGADADLDIALIKIDANNLCSAPVGDSSTVETGDKSVIIGNPLGTLGGSVTEGIISAVDRAIEIDGKTMHLIQTDAAVNPGNSGGGMFNGQGELIGIVVAKSSGDSTGSSIDNIGFVIPINNALDILGDLEEYGYVRGKAYTGMAYSESSGGMYSQYFGYGDSSEGTVTIASITPGSNAEKAGFSVGDRVISVNSTQISSLSDLKKVISEHSAGDTVSFEIERSGRTGTIELTLEEYIPITST